MYSLLHIYALYHLILGKIQQAKQQPCESSCLLIHVITQDEGMLQYLKKIIRGNIVSPWAKKEDRVFILFEDDDQVDQVMHFLSGVVESPQTDKKSADPVASIIQR
ncbi:hypothetical protein JOB18_035166 [Solea senegalensis]|uniref:Uncharacterized protein n=1 Tax=Solea senegalensis TaxID=28829 RepID=A0AAV6RJX8_SOLSE|nr:hypothetical protein JOB18_035166 [Solea senegalensis]KAG7505578.1 hypothetical protein JOB18_035166 [Solea senegalensis]